MRPLFAGDETFAVCQRACMLLIDRQCNSKGPCLSLHGIFHLPIYQKVIPIGSLCVSFRFVSFSFPMSDCQLPTPHNVLHTQSKVASSGTVAKKSMDPKTRSTLERPLVRRKEPECCCSSKERWVLGLLTCGDLSL